MKLDDKVIDYNSEFKKAKIFVVAICVISMLASIAVIKIGLDKAETNRETIYVADANNTLMLALANDVDLNAPNEAKAALKRMHYYLFNMTPSADYIKGSIAKAEAIGDESVVQFVEKMKEKGWYNKMIAEGISTEFMCDSIHIDNSDNGDYSYKVTLYGKTSTIYPDKIEFRSLQTACYMYDDARTIDNPNGSYVALWQIVKNDVLKIVERSTESMEIETPAEDNIGQDSTATETK